MHHIVVYLIICFLLAIEIQYLHGTKMVMIFAKLSPSQPANPQLAAEIALLSV